MSQYDVIRCVCNLRNSLWQ